MSGSIRTWAAGLTSAAVALWMVGAVFSGCATASDNNSDASACGANSTLCAGTCVNTQTDNANCGTCGTACPAGEVCSKGSCATSCGGGTTQCGNVCSDTKVDPNNCGTCGTKCGAGQVCSGTCGATCGNSQTLCGGDSGAPYCANTKTDNANCGGCGVSCGKGKVCQNSACSNSCIAADGGVETLCGADGGAPYCASTQTDNANCGGCGNVCGAGQVCQGAKCSNSCVGVDGGVETLCGADGGSPYCASTQTDNANCGGCGNVCGAGQVCQGGGCSNSCAAPDGGVETLCGADGGSPYCANTESDNANCGGCGIVCGSGQVCVHHACSNACASSDGGIETLCTPNGAPAYCTNTQTDNNNCGTCGNPCTGLYTCRSGLCVLAREPAGAYSIPFAPEVTTGTSISLGDDQVSGLIPMGFNFRFFSNTYSSVAISSNGFIGFDSGMDPGCCAGGTIPANDLDNNIIALSWTDLSPNAGGSITYEMRGLAPFRRFVVSYVAVPWFGSAATVTTQVILFESWDRIEIHTASQPSGHFYTQGAENDSGTNAYFLPGRVDANYALTNDGVAIYTY